MGYTNDVSGRAWEAELLRLRGDVLLSAHADETGAAETCYRDALAVAQRQQARSLQLRAATSLARLFLLRGEYEKGRQILAPTYGCFTEGFNTRDLKRAKELFDSLTTYNVGNSAR